MEKILNKIKEKFKFHKALKAKVADPHRDWKILLISFFAIIVLLIILSIYLLYEIRTAQIVRTDVAPKSSQNLLNEKTLDKVSQSFDQKAQKEKDLISNPPTYQDPSL